MSSLKHLADQVWDSVRLEHMIVSLRAARNEADQERIRLMEDVCSSARREETSRWSTSATNRGARNDYNPRFFFLQLPLTFCVFWTCRKIFPRTFSFRLQCFSVSFFESSRRGWLVGVGGGQGVAVEWFAFTQETI